MTWQKEIDKLIEKINSIPNDKIKIHSDYTNALQTVLWHTMIRKHGAATPSHMGMLCVFIAGCTGIPYARIESAAVASHQAGTAQEAKALAIKGLRGEIKVRNLELKPAKP